MASSNPLLSAMMRMRPCGNLLPCSNVLAATTRGQITYENLKTRNLKYKSAAKEKRKQARRKRLAGPGGLKDTTQEIPPFFQPQRYKLLYKVMEDHKNSGRYGRKPIPVEVKQNFAKIAKEYNEFKTAEKTLLDLERA